MNLFCKIIEIKGEDIVVEIENQQISLNLENFSKNPQIDQQYQIFLWDNTSPINNKNLAKIILEEILNGK